MANKQSISQSQAVGTEQEILLDISTKLAQAQTPDGLLNAFYDYAAAQGVDNMILSYFDDVAEGTPEWGTVMADRLLQGQSVVGSRFYLPDFPMSEIWFANPDAPVMVEDILTDPRVDEHTRESLTETYSFASVVLPIHNQGRWVGVLMLTWSKPTKISEEARRVYTALIRQVSPVIDAVRSTAELREALQQVQQLQMAIDASTIVAFTDQTGKITYVNDRFCEVSQYSREELIGQDHRIISSGYHSKEFIRDLWVTIANGEVWQGELKNKAKDGSHYWVDTTIVPLLNDEGKPYQYVAIRHEITRQKEEEADTLRRSAELETVIQVGAEAAMNLDMDTLLASVSTLIRDRFGFYHAHIYLYDPKKETLTLAGGAGEVGQQLLEKQHTIPLNQPDSIVARAARERRSIIVNDVTTSPDFLPNPLLPDTKSELAVPLIVGETLLGVLDAQSEKVAGFTDQDALIQMTLASQVAVAVQNANAFQQVEDARREVARIYESSADLLGSADAEGYFLNLNPAWETVLGWPLEELLKLRFDELVHPDDREPTEQEFNRQLSEGRASISLENRYRMVDGGHRWLSWSISFDAAANTTYFVTRDITEAREIEIERQSQLAIANALNAAHTPKEMLEAVLGYVKGRGVSSASLIYFEVDEQGSPEWAVTAASWTREGQADTDDEGVGVRYYMPEMPTTALWLQDPYRPILVEDIRTSDLFSDMIRQIYLESGGLASAMIPLYIQGRWLGIYVLTWNKVMTFTAQDRRIFQSINQQSSPVVDAARTAELVRLAGERAALLARVSAALSQAVDEGQIIQAVKPLIAQYKVERSTLIYMNNADSTADIVAVTTGDGEPLPLHVFPRTHFLAAEYPIIDLMQRGGGGIVPIESLDAAKERYDDMIYEFLRRSGSEAALSIPLHRANEFIGFMSFSWSAPQVFDKDMIGLFEAIHPSVSSTVSNRQLYLAEQHSREENERRAAEMEMVSRVSAEAATNLNVNELLQSVSDLIKANFGLYHAHIYLYDETDDSLKIAAGSGEIGRQILAEGRVIPLGRQDSFVAQAGRTLDGVIVNDVTENPNFLPHPLLPNTKAEMAIAMVVGNALIGVLDIQADKVDFFSESDIYVQGTLAAQIAVAIQNARSYEAAKESDRLKSEFLANMSHELRTPLNSIIGYSEVLLEGIDGELSADAIEDIGAIHGSGQHLLMIINDILDLAKIEARQMHIDPRPVPLAGFMQEIVHAGQILVKDKDVRLEVAETGMTPTAYADSVRLRQIVWNIISNAVKFTESGSVTVSVGQQDEDFAYVRVTDTGIGIRKEDLSLVFEQFQQVDGSSTRRAGGTGLGLAITRYLVEMHGGKIEVESEYGNGASFWFTLPLSKDAAG